MDKNEVNYYVIANTIGLTRDIGRDLEAGKVVNIHQHKIEENCNERCVLTASLEKKSD